MTSRQACCVVEKARLTLNGALLKWAMLGSASNRSEPGLQDFEAHMKPRLSDTKLEETGLATSSQDGGSNSFTSIIAFRGLLSQFANDSAKA